MAYYICKQIGYSVSYGVLHMWKVGVAQTRKRMILIASRVMQDISLAKIAERFALPVRPISWAIADLLDAENPASVFDSAALAG